MSKTTAEIFAEWDYHYEQVMQHGKIAPTFDDWYFRRGNHDGSAPPSFATPQHIVAAEEAANEIATAHPWVYLARRLRREADKTTKYERAQALRALMVRLLADESPVREIYDAEYARIKERT